MSATSPWRARLAAILTLALLAVPWAAPAQGSTLFALVDTGELFASADGGASWTIRSTLPVHDAVAMVAGATSSELLLASERGSFYQSADGGESWTAVGAVTASDLSALAGANGTYLLLAASGGVYRSVDSGITWTAVGAITAPDIVSAAHHEASWLALARTGGVYRSDDDGATWIAVGAITTAEAVELRSFEGKLYAISASGDLYESADAGASFTAVSTLSHVGTAALAASATELVACLGTGETAASANATTWTWRGAINQLTVRALATDIPTTTGVGPEPGRAFQFRAPFPNPARAAVWLALDLERAARVTIGVFDLAGRQVARPVDDVPVAAGPFARSWRPQGLAPGVYVLRAQADHRVGLRRMVWLGGR